MPLIPYATPLTALESGRACRAKATLTTTMPRKTFFSCLKCECAHLLYFPTRDAAKLEIRRYIEGVYNSQRPHSGLGWISPNDAALRFSLLHNR